jgi:ABC-type Fe3+ transport system permease subunit
MTAGAVGIGAGIAFVVLGVVLPCKLGDPGCSTQAEVASEKSVGDAFLATGIGAMIVGAVCLAVGIPLAVAGANEVKHQLGYALLVGPHGAGFRF